uniref:Putative secreted protein n=1 Tax=Anopheles darlingi TaxID=43151 RepID=A0A2M4D4M9_ANODA
MLCFSSFRVALIVTFLIWLFLSRCCTKASRSRSLHFSFKVFALRRAYSSSFRKRCTKSLRRASFLYCRLLRFCWFVNVSVLYR